MSEGKVDSANRLQVPNYPRGIDNPFNTFVLDNMRRYEGLNLEGKAIIPNYAWAIWERGRGKPWFYENTEPERTLEMTYDEIAKHQSGWKLHLNFDPNDPKKVHTVGTLLTALKDNDAITTFKIGRAQPGKEATIYVGHRDKAQVVASLVEEGLGDVLDSPEGQTLEHDIPFTEKVMARFELFEVDQEFAYYGAKGYPILKSDVIPLKQRELLSDGEKVKKDQESMIRANAVLRERYGAFYTGTGGLTS